VLISNRREGRGIRAALTGALALGLLSVTTSAFAVSINLVPGDLDILDADIIANPGNYLLAGATLGPNGFTPDSADIVGIVYEDLVNGGFIYRLTIEAHTTNASEFNTSFEVFGFGGADPTGGYSFGDATNVLGAFDAIDLDFDPDGTLDWEVNDNATDTWDGPSESIAFYFRDPRAPGQGTYNLINGITGSGSNYAPVPEPSTFALVGLCLVGLVRRRLKSSVQ
jgi:hypothetical protein